MLVLCCPFTQRLNSGFDGMRTGQATSSPVSPNVHGWCLHIYASQILLQLAASRGLEGVCLVNSEEEAALALKLGAWKATLLKEVHPRKASARLPPPVPSRAT